MIDAAIVLEDGTAFTGRMAGGPGVAAGEACFTTAMAGYEEAATDPSYVGQVLCFSYPLIGNYGVDPARRESEPSATGSSSGWASTRSSVSWPE